MQKYKKSSFLKTVVPIIVFIALAFFLSEYSNSQESSKEINSKLPNSPTQMLLGKDQSVWLTANNYLGINRVFSDGKVEKYRLPFNSPPLSIALDKNDALWSYGNQSNEVVRIAPDGQITKFTLPYPSNPLQMSLGKKYAWFSGDNSQVVVKINQSSDNLKAISTSLSSNPRDIIPSGDGLWLLDSTSLKIIYIDPSDKEAVFEFTNKILDLKDSGKGIWVSFQGQTNIEYIERP